MLALAPDGHRAVAWVTTSSGAEFGRVMVQFDGSPVTAIRDTLGDALAHAEAPPQVAFGPGGKVYVLYVVAKDVGKRFPVSALRVSRSEDQGVTWSEPMTVTDDSSVFGAHNFHSLYVADDGTVYASWLDGRNGRAATYMTSSRDGGATWAPNTRVSVDDSCPCCRTAVAAGTNGVVYVAWRTVLPGDVRDIVVARSTDYGASWEAPQRVHADDWVYAGCPHAGPSIRVDTTGRLHVLWWTGQPKQGGVFYTASSDSGRTFRPPLAIDAQKIPLATHVQLALGQDGRVITVWDRLQTQPSTIEMRVSLDHGQTFEAPITISDGARPAKHPVIGFSDRTAYIAWSEQGSSTNVVMRPVRW